MKNHWMMFYFGIVTVKVTGKGIERFINHLTKSEMLIWNVKRHGTAALTFNMRLPDLNKLRAAARKSECKIEFLRGGGLPFLLKRLWKNSGFVIGLPLFFSLIIYLSNTIWGIEIKGASPATEHQIRKELNQMGIKVGKLQFFLDDVESIQRELTNHVQEITWVGVELKGTTFHFQVVEKNEPEKQEYISPRHLVAKKKAVIVDMFVEKGVPIVKVHEHVLPGQLLVSGTYGQEGQTINVAAKGEILGETWYKSQVELPLKSTFQVFSGNEKRKYYLKIGKGNLRLNVWGFEKPQFSDYETERLEKTIQFLKWTIPLSIEIDTIRESEKVTRIYSNEDGIKMAKTVARNDLKKRLPEDAMIKGEKILHQSVENGKVNLIIHFQVIENIAQGQPIIQGD
jgi:similar to stage IV sporulation protein